jgi:hypothetical protein
MFGLERESGQRLQRRALGFITLFLLISSFVAFVKIRIAPTLPEGLLKPPPPTPNIFATPLSSPTPIGSPQAPTAPTLDVAPTVTLPGNPFLQSTTIPGDDGAIPPSETEEATLSPTPAAVLGGCSNTINITAPPNEVTVSGSVTFFGTATGEDFAAYDLQAFGPQTREQWFSFLVESPNTPILDGILGTTNFSDWLPGTYTIRLVVIDSVGGEVGQCAIQLIIESEIS